MDYSKWIYDAKDRMSLREVFEKHRTELPMLVIITDGFYGITHEEDLANLKVYWIRAFTTQKRCLSKQEINPTQERWLSIPLATNYKFYRIKNSSEDGGKNAVNIRDILQKKETPVHVMFDRTSIKIGYVYQRADEYQPLTLLKEYDEHYLCCHEITDNSLDRNRYLVATTVNIMCSPINGHKDKTPGEFQTYLRSLEKTVADIKFSRTEGFEDITEVRWPDSGTGNQLPDTFKALITSPSQLQVHPDDDGYIGLMSENPVVARQSVESFGPPPKIPERRSQRYIPVLPSKFPAGELTPPADNKLQSSETSMRKISFVPPQIPPLPPRPPSMRKSEDAEKQWLLEMKIEEVSEVLKTLKLDAYIKQFADDQIDGTILSALTDDILKDEYKLRPVEVIRLRKFVEKGHVPQ